MRTDTRSYYGAEDGLGLRGWERETLILRVDSMSRWRDLDGSFAPSKTDMEYRTDFVAATEVSSGRRLPRDSSAVGPTGGEHP